MTDLMCTELRMGLKAAILFLTLSSGCSQPSSQVARPWEVKPNRTLRQDLGIVRAGQEVHRTFRVRNDSEKSWTVAKIHNHCNCTAGAPSRESIGPGEILEVGVTYKAPLKTLREVHSLGVEFREPNTPFVWLYLDADVREPIAVLPQELSFTVHATGESFAETLEVRNMTGADIQLRSIDGSAPWLKASSTVIEPPQKENAARQVWKLKVWPQIDGLATGRHRAQLNIHTDCPECGLKSIPVELDLRGPIEARPSELAFGTIQPGTTIDKKILLRLGPGASPEAMRQASITHDLGDQLNVRCAEASSTAWTLTASLTPSETSTGPAIQGRVTIRFASKDLVPLEIPVTATLQGR